jgi:amidophosphoribosyltransferase
MGSRKVGDEDGLDYMLASESVALQYFGCASKDIIDIQPGQAVILEKGKAPRFYQVVPEAECTSALDIFEHVYLSRPDSYIDGISVYASRRNMGIKLAKKIAKELGPEALADIDVVIPIPETANAAARTVAQHLKKELVEGFVKNRYIFRTFIMPNQKLRRAGVRRKLNAIESEFRGKNILLVDDSIVRGTTSKEIVQMAREAGAKKIILASCAPPIT